MIDEVTCKCHTSLEKEGMKFFEGREYQLDHEYTVTTEEWRVYPSGGSYCCVKFETLPEFESYFTEIC